VADRPERGEDQGPEATTSEGAPAGPAPRPPRAPAGATTRAGTSARRGKLSSVPAKPILVAAAVLGLAFFLFCGSCFAFAIYLDVQISRDVEAAREALEAEDWDEAERLAQKVLDRRPRSLPAKWVARRVEAQRQLERGRAALAGQDYETAFEELSAAAEVREDDPDLQGLLATARDGYAEELLDRGNDLSGEGEHGEARAAYERALALYETAEQDAALPAELRPVAYRLGAAALADRDLALAAQRFRQAGDHRDAEAKARAAADRLEALEAAEAERRARAAEEARARGEKPYQSEWDRSVPVVELYLEDVLKDPDSFEAIEWSPMVEHGPFWAVRVKYRAKNSFGGYVVEERVALIQQGRVVHVE